MKRKTTLNLSGKAEKKEESIVGHPRPSEQTLTFLRYFARNCHIELQLPQGLQEIIVG